MADMSPELFAEIETLEQKHAENPGGRYFVPLANAYRKAGRVDQAETLIRDGLEHHPDYLSAHVVLGRCLRERGADGEAEETFRRVLETDPQNLVALRSLGEMAADGGRTDEARDWYHRLLSIDPMNEDARSALDSLAEEDRAHPIDVEPAGGDGLDLSLEAHAHPVDEDAPSIPASGAPQAAGDGDSGFDAVDVEAFEIGEPAGADQDEEAEDLESLEVETAYEREGQVEVTAYETHEDRDAGKTDEIEEEDLGLLTFEDPLDTDDVSIAGGSAESEPWSGADSEEVAADAAPASAGSGDDLEFDGDDLDFDIGGEDQLPAHPSGREEGPATLTMADLYARQGFHDRAAEVYRRLLSERGEDPEIRAKLEEAESRIADEADEETLHADAFADSVSEGFAGEGGDADAYAGSGLEGESRSGDEQEVSSFFASAGETPAEEAAYVEESGGNRSTDVMPGSTETIGAFLARLAAWRPGQPDVEPETEDGVDSPASTSSEDPEDQAVTDAPEASWGADEDGAWAAAGQAPEVSQEEADMQDASPWAGGFEETEDVSALDESAGTPDPSPWDASVEEDDSPDEDATLGPDAWDEEPAGPSPWDPPVEDDEPEDVAGAAGETDAGPVTDATWEEVRPESQPSAAKDESEEGSPGSGDEAIPAMPWETSEDPPPSPAAEGPEPGAEAEDDALALERLFAGEPASDEPPEESAEESPAPQASTRSEEEGESDGDDDDLESFQAWLQSLKT